MTNKVSHLLSSNSQLQKELSKVMQENEVLRAMLSAQQQQISPPSSVSPTQRSFTSTTSY